MIAAWKIRREFQRLGQQVSALHEALWEPWVQRRHDRTVRKGLPTFDGAVALYAKIALYLVYQPGNLPQSCVDTCKYLADHGYSPLIVANGGLPEKNRALLLPYVWKIMERPNLGYDFGGYRDGILQLQTWDVGPDKLLILNDSIWFPVFPGDTFLDRLESENGDVVGALLNEKGKIGFLESYLYFLDCSVLKNVAMRKFWQSYRLTGNKYKVIRRGERGHSAALLKAGYKLSPIFSTEAFLSLIRHQSNIFLEQTLLFGVEVTPSFSKERQLILRTLKDDDWRGIALNHIERVAQSCQFYIAFPYASVKLMKYPILKRRGDRGSVLWRRAYLAAVDAGKLDAPLPTVLEELRSQVTREVSR